MNTIPTPGWMRPLDRASHLLSIIGGVSLLFMVVVVSLSVIARYVFSMPILGSDEVVQLAAVVLVMLALPYATRQGAHVRVDVFDHALGRYGRMTGDITARVFSSVVLGVVVKRAWSKTLDAFEYGDTTNMLGLPYWPFWGTLTVGIALCVIVYVLEIVTMITGRGEE